MNFRFLLFFEVSFFLYTVNFRLLFLLFIFAEYYLYGELSKTILSEPRFMKMWTFFIFIYEVNIFYTLNLKNMNFRLWSELSFNEMWTLFFTKKCELSFLQI